MSPRLAQSHTPTPDVNGICKVCGWECVSLKTDQDDVEPQPGDTLTEEQIDLLHPGQRVYDKDGDVWLRQPDGKWKWTAATVSTTTLAYIFQPIKLAEDA